MMRTVEILEEDAIAIEMWAVQAGWSGSFQEKLHAFLSCCPRWRGGILRRDG